MGPDVELIYGTCVALGRNAAILKGASASGKSDLALRFLFETPADLEPALIADDQVSVARRSDRLFASAPKTIAGQMEVRGIGIIAVPYRQEAELRLIVQLADRGDVPRLPPSPPPTWSVCGTPLPVICLTPFEASAHLKLRLAVQSAALDKN